MKLFTAAILAKLAGNTGAEGEKPWLKLFNPTGAATWLISEYDPETGIAFGLADLGFGCPELGSVYIPELEAYKGPLGLGIERDINFKPNKTLAEYADEAYSAERIVA